MAGAIALMLEANPSLTPAQVKDILQRTATPLPPYYAYEVGAGMLNVHAAVLEAGFHRGRLEPGAARSIAIRWSLPTTRRSSFPGRCSPAVN